MRGMVAKGLTAALCVGLGLSAARADDADGGDLRSLPPAKPSFWSSWGAKKDKPEVKKPSTSAADVPARAPANDPLAVQAREEGAYHRRLEVCDRLMEIAVKNNDDAMQERIQQLMDRAFEVYQQRTAARAVPAEADLAALTRSAASRTSETRTAAVREVKP